MSTSVIRHFERETDGRWLAEVPELPGVMVYGKTKNDADVAVTALALRVIGALDQRKWPGFSRPATD